MSVPTAGRRGHVLIRGVLATLVAAGLVAVGCGDDDGGDGGASSAPKKPAERRAGGPAATTLSETGTDFKFSDPKPTVTAGALTVRLDNKGDAPHAIEIEGPKGEIETKVIQPGESTSKRVRLPAGKYEFYCPVDGHKQIGMKGTLTVR